MSFVESTRVLDVQVAHALRYVGVRRLHEAVVVGAEQTPRVEAPAIAPADAPQDPDEDRAVSVVQEDRHVVVPLRPDVVVRAGFGVATGSSHAATVAASGPHERSRACLGTFAS